MSDWKWSEKDVVKKNRIRKLGDVIFGWMDGNILHSGLIDEMTDHEFKLYGFYTLAGDNLYGLSKYKQKEISAKLRMPKRDIITARNKLVQKDLIAYQNKEFTNSKKLKYQRTVVQVLSLPLEKVIITRRAAKGAAPKTTKRIAKTEKTKIPTGPRWGNPPTHIKDEINKILGRKN